ncbi:putative membrane protein (TIGR02226 family) [Breoghania corrubedonensis]|uniref:Putative membrane protein (TIGR02226 family) n=1 Tax=Breoghania corrubedonensis TaxID=665038 RepID=A0A2T5UTY0_9HYPH|nr:DUF4159 domain-containing protein [Breoghania corrubedonensis]PTW54979.1 putative membrane protein (TIGR02226 family) [Breoghania corrubedonensis]
MMFGLPLAFTSPFVLAALLSLPVIWWLLRFTPPRPKEISFPPTRLLLDVEKNEETPARSPWWLTLLRLLLAAILILALAGPVWRPLADTGGGSSGPLWLILDNGWTSAPGWDARLITAERLIDGAESEGRPVLVAASADGPGQSLNPIGAGEARERLRALEPRSWVSRPDDLLPALRAAAAETAPGAIAWLQDGLGGDPITHFAETLRDMAGDVRIGIYMPERLPAGLKGVRNDANALTATVIRDKGQSARDMSVQAIDMKGLVIAEAPARFDTGASEAEVRFELPVELRNEIARLQVEGERAAGAVQLVDERWRRRTVGLLSGDSTQRAQPLLAPLYYLRRALTPFADLREPRSLDLAQALPELIEQNVSVLLMADIGNVPPDSIDALRRWVAAGGVLVRFAGPHMAARTDDLVPVDLRSGGRALGGSLSWEQPQPLTGFSENGPFAGLAVPDDVTVRRQVLAEPDATLPDKTWASLADGTPLVTAMAIDRGWVVLFHVTADTTWSNLPLSGTFVDMLRRILAFSAARVSRSGEGEGSAKVALAPMRLLDGFGHFVSPGATARPVSVSDIDGIEPGREHPPGLYGVDDAFRALNLLKPDSELVRFDASALGSGISIESYRTAGPLDMRAGLFVVALLLLIADALAVLVLGGGWRLLQRPAGAAAALLAMGLLAGMPTDGHAQGTTATGSGRTVANEAWALDAVLTTRLAYVVTGNAQIDETSRAGLYGLSRYLESRTALEPGDPIGVRIDQDELSFFPLLYWPIDENAAKPDAQTTARIDAYMRGGGTILFDTRDEIGGTAATGGFGTSPATRKLREILSGLDIPALEPVPPDHVLTKAFYLLDEFPGRWSGGQLWVEATPETDDVSGRPVRAGDGVSPILISANDFASAWATDEIGNPLYPTVPADPMQRELAYRSGVNIVMYTLTGNYKADQVHVPALLERLGQ